MVFTISFQICVKLKYRINEFDFIFKVLNFKQPVIAEQLVGGCRLFCVISNLTDDTQVTWLKNAKPLKAAEKFTVGIT